MPSSWTQIIVCQTIKIYELDTEFSQCQSYTQTRSGKMKQWPLDTLSFNELINQQPILNKLNIEVRIKIIRILKTEKYKKIVKYQSDIINYKHKYKFKWNLNPSHLCRLHTHFRAKKPFSSKIIGDIFNVYYIPNQNKFKLQLLGLPNKEKIDGLQVKWTIYIEELPDIKYSSISLLTFKSNSTSNTVSNLLIPSLTFDAFREMKYITFLIEIEILNEYDSSGNIMGINYEEVWEKIIIQDKKNKEKEIAKKKAIAKQKKLQAKMNGNNGGNVEQKVEEEVEDASDDDEKGRLERERIEKEKKEEFRLWLKDEVELPQYFDLLIKHGYDNLDAVSTVKSSHLKLLGMNKMGHRQQLLKYVQIIKDEQERIMKEQIEDEKKKQQIAGNSTTTVLILIAAVIGIWIIKRGKS